MINQVQDVLNIIIVSFSAVFLYYYIKASLLRSIVSNKVSRANLMMLLARMVINMRHTSSMKYEAEREVEKCIPDKWKSSGEIDLFGDLINFIYSLPINANTLKSINSQQLESLSFIHSRLTKEYEMPSLKYLVIYSIVSAVMGFGLSFIVFVNDIKKLYQLYSAGKTIVFPLNGLGTGLSKLPEKAPNLFKLLNAMLVEFFGITHGTEAEGYKLKRVVK